VYAPDGNSDIGVYLTQQGKPDEGVP
jgi:hypothetical protein